MSPHPPLEGLQCSLLEILQKDGLEETVTVNAKESKSFKNIQIKMKM